MFLLILMISGNCIAIFDEKMIMYFSYFQGISDKVYFCWKTARNGTCKDSIDMADFEAF